MNSLKPENENVNWHNEKIEFAREVFVQAKIFMKHDNDIIMHSAVFTGAIANYIEKNPDFIEKVTLFNSGRTFNSDKGIEGSDFWDGVNQVIDAFGRITDIVREDKKFFAELLTNIFNW